jgi:hypothetical protein
LPPGKARIAVDFVAEVKEGSKDQASGRSIGPGIGRLSVDGRPSGEARFAWFGNFNSETFDVGSPHLKQGLVFLVVVLSEGVGRQHCRLYVCLLRVDEAPAC